MGKEAESLGYKTCSGGTTPSRFVGLNTAKQTQLCKLEYWQGIRWKRILPSHRVFNESFTAEPQPSPSVSLGARPFWVFKLGEDPQKARAASPQGCRRCAKPSLLAGKCLKTALERHRSRQNLTGLALK